MANQKKATDEKTIFYYGGLLTDAEKMQKSYTYNWKDVTDPDHLKIRAKEVSEANKIEVSDGAPHEAE